jgi:hypothetical protein
MPVALISGPFLSDLFISLVSMIFIIRICLEKKFHYIKNNYSYFFISFFLLLLLNSLINFIEIKSLKNSFFYFRFGLFFLSIVFFLDSDEHLIKKIFYSFLFSFSLLVFDGFFQFFSGYNILGFKLYDGQVTGGSRVSSFFGTELIMGSYLSRLSSLLFGLYILNRNFNKFFKFYFYMIFIAVECLVFLSGERTSFFILNFSFLIFILLSKDFKKMRLLMLSSSFLLIFIISIFKPTSAQRMIYQTLHQIGLEDLAYTFSKNYKIITNNDLNLDGFTDSTEVKKIYLFSPSHQSLYITATNMFKKNIFFGIGPNNFRYLCDKEEYKYSSLSCSTHPHNFYLQFLSELGLSGFFFIFFIFLTLLYFLLNHFINKFKKKYIFTDFEICCLSILFVNIWPFMPSGGFFNNWLSIVCYFPLGFFIWSRNRKNKFFFKY